jgi:uncharacterized iron-regulated membrane protein
LLEGGADEGWQNFSVAHWFLILLFLVSWTGFLVWRARRVEEERGEDPTGGRERAGFSEPVA